MSVCVCVCMCAWVRVHAHLCNCANMAQLCLACGFRVIHRADSCSGWNGRRWRIGMRSRRENGTQSIRDSVTEPSCLCRQEEHFSVSEL